MMPGAPQKNPVAAVTPAGGSVHQGNMQGQYVTAAAGVAARDMPFMNSQGQGDLARVAVQAANSGQKSIIDRVRETYYDKVQAVPAPEAQQFLAAFKENRGLIGPRVTELGEKIIG